MKYYYWKPTIYTKREYSNKYDKTDISKNVLNQEVRNDLYKENNNNIRYNNKKNEVNDKLNERFLIKQTNPNPFFINSNYIDDLEIQNKFLR